MFMWKVTEATLAVFETMKVSHIPPTACPGTPHMIRYLPAFVATKVAVCRTPLPGSGAPGLYVVAPGNAGATPWCGRGIW